MLLWSRITREFVLQSAEEEKICGSWDMKELVTVGMLQYAFWAEEWYSLLSVIALRSEGQ